MTLHAETATHLEVAGLTHPGQVRPANEDTWALEHCPGGELMLVADGMGGHRTGEVASGLASSGLVESLRELDGPPPESLARAFQRANLAVYQQAMRRSESRGMGTTLTAILVDDQYALVGHVGDSRAYLVRDGAIRQVTRDHSWVAERVRQGIITEAEAREHRWRNVITNALGSYPQVRLDLVGVEIRDGDQLVLCSDGLTTVLTDEEILGVLLDHAAEPAERAAQALVDAANAGGGPDNITVVLARVRRVVSRPKRYALPRLEDAAAPVAADPGPDSLSTLVLEPPARATRRRGGPLFVLVGLLYVLVFILILRAG
jgi:protein phosphatase